MHFADAKPPDLLDFWVGRAMLLLAAALGAWLTFNRRRALKRMVQFASRWSRLGSRWSINPERPGWIWFYRIDGAVVLAGVVWIFVQYYLER
jgi:hypothetical protein